MVAKVEEMDKELRIKQEAVAKIKEKIKGLNDTLENKTREKEELGN